MKIEAAKRTVSGIFEGGRPTGNGDALAGTDQRSQTGGPPCPACRSLLTGPSPGQPWVGVAVGSADWRARPWA